MEYSFSAKLGARQGAPAADYLFRVAAPERNAAGLIKGYGRRATYSTIMVNECKKYGMKPICDHPSWCSNDDSALYIGHANYIVRLNR